MLFHTKGIVFSSVKFKETSSIVKIYTEAYGMQSYIVNGVRSKRAKGKSALYQPLSLLDMVVYHKPDKDINRISEARFATTYRQIPFDPLKRTIGIFLTEVFGKVLREESENKPLFDFLFHSLSLFDHLEKNEANFHLQLLLKASHYFGFGPKDAQDFIHQLGESGFHFSTDKHGAECIDGLLNADYGTDIQLSSLLRRDILDHVLKFYKIHVDSLREIKSLPVLKVILNN